MSDKSQQIICFGIMLSYCEATTDNFNNHWTPSYFLELFSLLCVSVKIIFSWRPSFSILYLAHLYQHRCNEYWYFNTIIYLVNKEQRQPKGTIWMHILSFITEGATGFKHDLQWQNIRIYLSWTWTTWKMSLAFMTTVSLLICLAKNAILNLTFY